MYVYIEQSNESEISPIKPTSVTKIQAWIRRVFRDNDCVQVKAQRVELMEKHQLNYTDRNCIQNLIYIYATCLA